MNLNFIVKHSNHLRKELHKNPEISGKEKITSKIILKHLETTKPDEIKINPKTNAVVAFYKSRQSNNRIVLRSELDAVAITEKTGKEYSSIKNGAAHSCGHDGHMAISCGIGMIFGNKRPLKNDLYLLFQPEEETGRGAQKIIKDKLFSFPKDSLFLGFHNIPGYPMGDVLLKDGVFSPASTGIKITIKGKTSHASTPSRAVSSVLYISKLIKEFIDYKDDDSLITITHVNAGDQNFGITPGDGQICLAIRSFNGRSFNKTIGFIKALLINRLKPKRDYTIEFCDSFPSTTSSTDVNSKLCEIFKENNASYRYLNDPMPWSEDFGIYLNQYNGAFIGIGSGRNQPDLHSEDYDFPTKLVSKGINVFKTIIDNY